MLGAMANLNRWAGGGLGEWGVCVYIIFSAAIRFLLLIFQPWDPRGGGTNSVR